MFFYLVLSVIVFCNLWLFFCLHRAFGRGWWYAAFVLWFGFPTATWYMRHIIPEGVFWSWVMQAGFMAIGVSAIAAGVCLSVALVERIVSLLRPRGCLLRRVLAPQRSVPLALCVALLLSGYALWEAQHPRLVHLVISTDKLPAGMERFRIAAFSDLHLSRSIGPEFLEPVVHMINEADADVFVSLGDLVDTDMRGRDADAALLRSIKTRLGSYGVLGNHEQYRGLKNSLDFHAKAGIRLLRNEYLSLGPIELLGVDDPVVPIQPDGTPEGLATTLRQKSGTMQPHRPFALFLCHRPQAPDTFLQGPPLFDLMLSGHTHGGQIQPAGWFFGHFMHKAPHGLGDYAGAKRFVTNGVGYWGPPMRLGSPPEVLIIDLVPESSRTPGP